MYTPDVAFMNGSAFTADDVDCDRFIASTSGGEAVAGCFDVSAVVDLFAAVRAAAW